MRLVAISLAILAAAATPSKLAADDAPKRSTELQVLDRWIGAWESVVTNKTTGDKFNTVENRKWSREGKFVLSEDLNLSAKKEAHFLLTYDSNAKVYRTCFIEEESAAIILGTWDKETQTMKWNGTDGGGGKLTGFQRFIDKDQIEWSMAVTGPDGKVVVELSAKQTRRKE